MFERFKRSNDAPARRSDTGAVATAERDNAPVDQDRTMAERDRPMTTDRGMTEHDRPMTTDRGMTDHERSTTTDPDRDRAMAAQDRELAERERETERDRALADRERDTTAGTALHDRDRDRIGDGTTTRARDGAATRAALETARARQRDEFGGINWGASFFGWLVAVGVAALLVALLAAAGAAIGLTSTSESEATGAAEEIGIGGGIALLIVLMIAYYAGGYVAGRMSRFDGGRQGMGTWAIGLLVTIALAIAGVVLGSEYNVLEQLNLPALPVGESTLTTGGIIALAAIVIGTLLAAMFGGKVGERYHRKVDRAGFVD